MLIEETEIRGNGVSGSGVLFLSVWIAELRRRCELLYLPMSGHQECVELRENFRAFLMQLGKTHLVFDCGLLQDRLELLDVLVEKGRDYRSAHKSQNEEKRGISAERHEQRLPEFH